LLQSYGGNGGVFDNWRQIGVEQHKDHSKAQDPSLDLRPPGSNHVKVITSPEPCIPGGQSTLVQPKCPPPPYSPLLQAAKLPATPKKTRVVNKKSDPIATSDCLKRSHGKLLLFFRF
jgi:hypothetical protein